jgi:hypothetical protein
MAVGQTGSALVVLDIIYGSSLESLAAPAADTRLGK